MNDLCEWDDLLKLKECGVESISVDYPSCGDLASINGDEFNALRISDGPNYNIRLNVDSTGLKRLQNALKNEPRKPEDELKHELNVMHKVNEFEGVNVREKIDKYFDNVDNKAKACEMEENNRPTIDSRYKIKHK